MELTDQIRKISFVFFIILGLAHFMAGLFYINGYFVPESGLINRVLFIPFALTALIYGYSSLKYKLQEFGKNSKIWDTVFISVAAVLFLLLLAIELFVVDSTSPLIPSL